MKRDVYGSGQRVGTAVTSLLPVNPKKSRYRRKFFVPKNENGPTLFRKPRWHRWHLFFTCSIRRNWDIEGNFFGPKNVYAGTLCGHRVGIFDTSLLPVRPAEIEISKEIFLDRKTKMLAHCLGNRVGTFDTSLLPVQTPEIVLSKKNILDRKTKMLAHCLGNPVGTVDTSLLPLQPPEIEISKKYFFGPKNENACTLFRKPRWHRWYLPFTSATPRNRDIEEIFFWTEKRKCLHTV